MADGGWRMADGRQWQVADGSWRMTVWSITTKKKTEKKTENGMCTSTIVLLTGKTNTSLVLSLNITANYNFLAFPRFLTHTIILAHLQFFLSPDIFILHHTSWLLKDNHSIS